MGQYHEVYNITKKEKLNAHHMGSGSKLMEQVGWEKSTSSALFLLLANSNGCGGGDAVPHPYIGRWAGDQIVVQGDYAGPGAPGFISDTDDYTDISLQAMGILNANFEE